MRKVSFTIGKNYNCDIQCDVVGMDVCHLILGCSWKFKKMPCGMMDVLTHILWSKEERSCNYFPPKMVTLVQIKKYVIPFNFRI